MPCSGARERFLLSSCASLIATCLRSGRPNSVGPITLRDYDPNLAPRTRAQTHLRCSTQPLAVASQPGKLDKRNARYVLDLLDRAIKGTVSGEFAAIVTAPVHKSVINDGGVPFTGHTEYLAEHTGGALPVMMLAAPGMRAAPGHNASAR